MFSVEYVTGLENGRLKEPCEAQVLEDAAEDEEDNSENIACVCEEQGSSIGIDCTINDVEYWNSVAAEVFVKLLMAPSIVQYHTSKMLINDIMECGDCEDHGDRPSYTSDIERNKKLSYWKNHVCWRK
ncbi:hypothetical protein Trydic_g12219 [Trypoxylus dichotomus]